MKMIRHYYITDDLDDLAILEEELERRGIIEQQMNILSYSDAEVHQRRHLHDVSSFMKKDVVHSAQIGALIGILFSGLMLAVVFLLGLSNTPAGWLPWGFLSVVIVGFCTWEGGLFGIQIPNVHFKRFEQALSEGKHVFFVDVDPKQEEMVEDIVRSHPKLKDAGTSGSYTPRWIMLGQQRMKNFIEVMP